MAIQSSDSNGRPTKRGLGRGLAALIPESDFDLLSGVARGSIAPAPIEPTANNQVAPDDFVPQSKPNNASIASSEPVAEVTQNQSSAGEVRYIALAQIEANPFQPRQVWNEAELEDLTASLREHGVLQPILVRPLPGTKKKKEERFQLVAGERRWRAAARAELKQIPAIVRAVDDKSALELAIIENVQRHDISSIESAQAYRRLSSEFSLSQEQIAGRVGKSRASIANTMRLLDLPEEAIQSIRNNEISEGHGRALLTAASDGARRALLRRVLRDKLSVREVERLAREGGENEAPTNVRLPRANAADIARLEDKLQHALGSRLKLRVRKNGGQIIIDYSSTEELQRLANKLSGGKE